jgi:coenzyme F420-0:L-glutamate ligase/coenzyme F420-1:gamma-L-glutamate ligase
MIQIQPVVGIGEVAPHSDIAGILAEALAPMGAETGDILVITSKIISKAEGRHVLLSDIEPSPRAHEIATAIGKDSRLIELSLRESTDIVRQSKGVFITRHKLGLVMANAGIDASNIGSGDEDRVLLLPEDPDASAATLRAALKARLGIDLGIVLSDSFGRPWRHGVVNVAIGASGIPALIDRRGDTDRDGRLLQVTQIAYGDLLASAAGLAMGEAAEGIPAALVRGAALGTGDIAASAVVRPVAEDLFR